MQDRQQIFAAALKAYPERIECVRLDGMSTETYPVGEYTHQ
jgi:hypothetical protein